MKKGILYIAIGEDFVDEAKTSVGSVRRHMGDIPIAIVTDSTDYNLEPFDHHILIDNTEQIETKDRIWLWDTTIKPEYSPFEKTLYLDTDTYLCDDVSEMFGLLDQYDLAIARTPEQDTVSTLPEPWHHYNTGVVAYRDSEAANRLFNKWSRIFQHREKTQDDPIDQPSFAEALYLTDIRWFTLPQRYNIRYSERGRSGFIADDPKIVHGRGEDAQVVADELKKVNGARTYRPKISSPGVPTPQNERIYRMESFAHKLSDLCFGFLWEVRHRGALQAASKTLQYSLKKSPFDRGRK
jgi:hypothetical protein